jgi:hypothetical protein
VVQLVVAMCYKPEGRGFDFRWRHWDSSLTSSFQPNYGPGSTQKYLVGGKVKAAVVWGSQLYHTHVPTVKKFWEPQPLEALMGGLMRGLLARGFVT